MIHRQRGIATVGHVHVRKGRYSAKQVLRQSSIIATEVQSDPIVAREVQSGPIFSTEGQSGPIVATEGQGDPMVEPNRPRNYTINTTCYDASITIT
jgi:hypothetical protein